jgi:hypothetical protein
MSKTSVTSGDQRVALLRRPAQDRRILSPSRFIAPSPKPMKLRGIALVFNYTLCLAG